MRALVVVVVLALVLWGLVKLWRYAWSLLFADLHNAKAGKEWADAQRERTEAELRRRRQQPPS